MKKYLLLVIMTLLFHILAILPAHSIEMRRDTLCTSISFRRGYSIVDPSFADNDAALRRMTTWLDSLAAGEATIRQVTVRGSASPEGYTSYNRRLSLKRAENTGRYLMVGRSLPDTIVIDADSDVDWGLLRDMVLASGQAWSAEAARIIEETPVWIFDETGKIIDGRKRRLSMLEGGRPWFYMLEHFFPAMRNAGCIIVYEHEPDAVAEATVAGADTTVAAAVINAAPPAAAAREAEPAQDAVPVATGHSGGNRLTALLKTNMLFDAAAVPNIALEIAIGARWSVEAGWMYAGWKSDSRHRSWRVNGGELGARYWPGARRSDDGRRLTGHHVGIYGQMLTYDFQFGGKGEIADGLTCGAGMAYGYSLPVARHLNIDFTLGIGWLRGKYKEYRPVDDCVCVWVATRTRNWFGPTKAEISLVWYIGGNPTKEGGRR